MSMSTAQLDAFLDRTFPTPLGVIATVRGDGSPQVTPVWFRWEDRRVRVWTTDSRAWVRNVAGSPRVAFAVHEDDPPCPAVLLRGQAVIATGDRPEIHREIRAITQRYISADQVDSYIADWPTLLSIVTIDPDHVTSWGEAGPDTIQALGKDRDASAHPPRASS